MTDQLAAPSPVATNGVAGEPEADVAASGYRYPGSPPFADTDIDRLVFRGRRKEIDLVLHSILSVDLFLVYAVSGVGKTSLLTAGVLEPLRQRDYFPVIVRLNDPTRAPVALIEAQIRDAGTKAEGITVSRSPALRGKEPSTLWELFGGLEVWRGNTLQHLVVIFDQFEELFTLGWSAEQRNQFIEQLGQVLRHYRGGSDQSEVQDDAVLLPPDVKITIVMREDSLGELEALAQHVPQIMRHRFRLDGLSPDQAKAAICEPAAVNDPRLLTQRFAYSDGAAEAILDFLQAKDVRDRPGLTQSIDPCQLQIICQHVERSILAGKPADIPADSVVEISEADLGGKEGLDRILRDFYRNELARFPSKERKLVRHLCESGLINQNGRRLSLEEGEICADYKVTKPMLEQLVDRRLLRAEPRVGSIYYELAHDTLAAPVMAYRDEARAARRRRRQIGIGAVVGVGAVVGLAFAFRQASSRNESASAPHIEEITDQVEASVPVIGNVRKGGDDSTFEFKMPDGGLRALEVRPDGDLDVSLAVSFPDGQFESTDVGLGGEPERLVLSDPSPEKYRVVVTGRSEGSFTLAFLPVEALSTSDGGLHHIDGPDDFKAFVFDVSDDQPLAVEVQPRGSLDVTLGVTDPSGASELADRSFEGGAERVVPVDSSPGQYRVVVTGRSAGDFSFSFVPVKVLRLGEPESERITGPDDSKAFVIDVTKGRPVVVNVVPQGGLDVSLEMTGPNGQVEWAEAASAGGTESAVLMDSSPGRYRAVVTGSSPGEFRASIEPVDELAVGETTSGTIRAAGDSAAFVFDAPPDQPITIEVTPDEGLDVVLSVTDVDGFLQDGQAAGVGGVEEVFLDGSVSGRHRIVVSGSDSTSGRFELSAVEAQVADMTFGDSVSGTLDRPSAGSVFSFESPNDQPILVHVLPSNSLDAVLDVTAPDGSLWEADAGAEGGPEDIFVDTGSPGTYQVVVRGYETTTGDFEVSARNTEPADVAVGESVTGTLGPAGAVSVFEFEAPDDQPILVEVVPDADLNVEIDVTGPGDVYPNLQPDDAGATASMVVQGSGRYRVIVSRYDSLGDFTLTVRAAAPAEVAAATAENTVTG
jgi:Novel STAND NTPase 1